MKSKNKKSILIDEDIHTMLRIFCTENNLLMKGTIETLIKSFLKEKGVKIDTLNK